MLKPHSRKLELELRLKENLFSALYIVLSFFNGISNLENNLSRINVKEKNIEEKKIQNDLE